MSSVFWSRFLKFEHLIHLRSAILLSPESRISGDVLEIPKRIFYMVHKQMMNASKERVIIKKREIYDFWMTCKS
jgi:hypothetical protein